MITLFALTTTGCSNNQSVESTTKTLPTTTNETQTQKNQNQTTQWTTYTNLGISLKYPNDESYKIENPEPDHFIVTQTHPGERIHVWKTKDNSLTKISTTSKTFSGTTWKQYHRDGMGNGYGYITEKNGSNYIVESTLGPENKLLELIMTTINFE